MRWLTCALIGVAAEAVQSGGAESIHAHAARQAVNVERGTAARTTAIPLAAVFGAAAHPPWHDLADSLASMELGLTGKFSDTDDDDASRVYTVLSKCPHADRCPTDRRPTDRRPTNRRPPTAVRRSPTADRPTADPPRRRSPK